MDGQCRNAFAIEAKVVGAEHALLGEVPVIFVVPRSGYAADAGKLLAFPRERLSAYWLPNAVRYIDEIPRTGSGKILRFARRFARIRGRGASLVQRVAVLKKIAQIDV